MKFHSSQSRNLMQNALVDVQQSFLVSSKEGNLSHKHILHASIFDLSRFTLIVYV
jgi:hypothetical protein